ncbi:MAG: NAD(P)-dependent oxidoreductase [Pseudomonadota bacterium]
MSNTAPRDGIQSGRLPAEVLRENFADLHAPLDPHEALVAADRCYFCHDAPCVTACPTAIDIPLFIRQIATGTPEASAKTIFEQNILGGMCARVCPTETLCEEACVREAAEGKPVEIGRLQRFATDRMMDQPHPFTRAAPTGKTVAVVGAGPAGLACAHRLAMRGHEVTIHDARAKGGGLNEYGIAAYKSVDDFAQAEVDWLLSIGGITLITDQTIGTDITLGALKANHDAVFLAIGLMGARALGLGEGATPAIDFIADLRQADDLSSLEVGRHVVVVGGGMTAVDAAVQSKLLGAEAVTIVYRRGKDAMSASLYEQNLAAQKGVVIRYNAQPVDSTPDGIIFEYTADGPDGLKGTGETFELRADQVFAAIGQMMDGAPDLTMENDKIKITGAGRTSADGIWAGGDCATGGDDLTVTAVAEGRDAAEDIHQALMA